MFSRPIPATAANLIETSQVRRRYYSAQVYAQTQLHSLFLSSSYSGGTTTRHDQARGLPPYPTGSVRAVREKGGKGGKGGGCDVSGRRPNS
ncbi:unnamed protein product, partial [Brenthis ino]